MGLWTRLFNWFKMKFVDIIKYNSSSAKKNGWDPSWFGGTEQDSELVKQIKIFQNQHRLTVDGLVGPTTFRRALTKREADGIEPMEEVHTPTVTTDHIICNGEEVPIGCNTVTMNEDGALELPPSSYQTSLNFERKPTMIVTHWDAALSAQSCFKILKKRKISSHFVIDNDGTIYQMVDTNNVAWHAKGVNDISIGIDFSNAYYAKYQKWYTKKGFGRRPILDDSVTHGRKHPPHLGYYPSQLDSYRELLRVLCKHYEIPLACPEDSHGNYKTGYHVDSAKGLFRGVVCHFNLSKRKIDCAGLKLGEIIKELNED